MCAPALDWGQSHCRPKIPATEAFVLASRARAISMVSTNLQSGQNRKVLSRGSKVKPVFQRALRLLQGFGGWLTHVYVGCPVF